MAKKGKKKEEQTLRPQPIPQRISIKESVAKLENLLVLESGNKKAIDSIKRIIEALKKRDKPI